MAPAGTALLKMQFDNTKLWPSKQFNAFGPPIDLEKAYKEALAGRVVTVMEVSSDKQSYLVLGDSKEVGMFLWSIEAGDVRSFLPVIKKHGTIIPAGMSPFEEAAYMAEVILKDSLRQKR